MTLDFFPDDIKKGEMFFCSNPIIFKTLQCSQSCFQWETLKSVICVNCNKVYMNLHFLVSLEVVSRLSGVSDYRWRKPASDRA